MSDDLLENNLAWAAARTRADPGHFRRFGPGPAPDHLWIGCSDCHEPAHEAAGLQPGGLLVHRNLANLAPVEDLGLMAALQFALEVVKVRHIVVCGHCGCAGVRAALEGGRRGALDHWLHGVRRLCEARHADLEAIQDPEMQVNFIAELNVVAQVRALARNPIVLDAWARRQELALHGWIYSIRDGLLRDLQTTFRSRADAGALSPAPAPSRRRAGPRRGG